MLVSLKWLREYVDLPADVDVDDLAHRLTMASAEVEGVRRVGGAWDRDLVRVGAVLDVRPHPDADRLRLATVDWGGEEPQTVVCGAPNLAVGQRIAFGREGARLVDGHTGRAVTLKRSKIRGVESAGMVLSERELGLSEAHEGIIELPGDAPVGAALVDVLGDVVLDVHVWPNRPDMMCMTGIAREVATITGAAVRAPSTEYAAAGPPIADLGEIIRVDIPERCRRFTATLLEGVEIGPSPAWMQERLVAAGMRPISNVVDITNYVMLEIGQPLHAFDFDRVQGPIVVRAAVAGERLRTLDGIERDLDPDMMVIADERGPIALAGVMGGASTEVHAGTSRVLLEAAWWDPPSIRRTSTRLALRSEASSRFERNLPLGTQQAGLERATKLFVELCGATARAGRFDTNPAPEPAPPVSIDRERLDTVIGFHVPTPEVLDLLESLGCGVGVEGEGAAERFVVTPPWWRTDLLIADDVAEEVVRLAGYDRLPPTTIRGAVPRWEPRPLAATRDRLRDALVGAGLREVITYSLTTDAVLERVLAPEDLSTIAPLRVRNALSSDRQVLRPTLRHAVLETTARNLRVGVPQVAIFEAARVYLPGHAVGSPLPAEREVICGAVSGLELDRWGRPTERALDFFDAKAAVEGALAAVGVRPAFVPDVEFALLPGRTARISAGDGEGALVGLIGDVHPDTLAAFGIDDPVTLFEIDVERVLAARPARRDVEAPPRFPAVEQDIAVVVDEDVQAGALRAVIEASPLVATARPFDVYRGEPLRPGTKSVAFSVRYQVPDRTLTTEDANREQERILRRLERGFDATRRG